MHVLTELALRALLLVLLFGLHVVEPCFDDLELGTMESGVMLFSRRVFWRLYAYDVVQKMRQAWVVGHEVWTFSYTINTAFSHFSALNCRPR